MKRKQDYNRLEPLMIPIPVWVVRRLKEDLEKEANKDILERLPYLLEIIKGDTEK